MDDYLTYFDKNKTEKVFNGQIPRYQSKGICENLFSTNKGTYQEIKLSNIDDYSQFILYSKSNGGAILASTTVSKEQLVNSSINTSIVTIYAVEPLQYQSSVYYSNGSIYLKCVGGYDSAELVGIKK